MSAPVPGPFVHESAAARVVFAAGAAARVGDEADALGMRRVLVISTAGRGRTLAAALAEPLGERLAGLHPEAQAHTPAAVTERATEAVRERRADGLVAVGGGSAIGLAKAVALRTGLGQIAVPTTYSGSEMTAIAGETRDGRKTTRKDERVRPATVLYDVALTLDLPPEVSAASGMNAMAHAVEALYAEGRSPLVALMAERGIAALAEALPGIVARPGDEAVRATALYGAWLCGTCLGSVAMGLHHKLCHALGGACELPHAATHAVLLPHTLAYNSAGAPQAAAAVARALGVEGDAATGLQTVNTRLGLPGSLRQLGLPEEAIAPVAEEVAATPFPNPTPVTAEGVRALLGRAWSGQAVGG